MDSRTPGIAIVCLDKHRRVKGMVVGELIRNRKAVIMFHHQNLGTTLALSRSVILMFHHQFIRQSDNVGTTLALSRSVIFNVSPSIHTSI